MDNLPIFDDDGWLKQQAEHINLETNDSGDGSGKPGEASDGAYNHSLRAQLVETLR
jgi:hypothetical protein